MPKLEQCVGDGSAMKFQVGGRTAQPLETAVIQAAFRSHYLGYSRDSRYNRDLRSSLQALERRFIIAL